MKSQFARNILHLASGAIASQVVVLAAVPLLARLYAPEEFGRLSLFASAYGIAIGVVTLKFDNAIILPREESTAIRLTALTCVVAAAVSASFALTMFGSWLLIGRPEALYIGLLPIGTLLGAVYTCCQQWSARRNNYKKFSRSRLVGSLVNVGLAVGLAAVGLSGSLVVAWIAGLVASLAYVGIEVLRGGLARYVPHISIDALRGVASAFRQFPIYQVPSYLVLSVGQNAVPFLLQVMFSLNEVGQFGLANRLLLAPSALVGGAVSEAFRAEFVNKVREGQPATLFFKSTLRRVVLVGVPVFGIIALIAPYLFTLILGEQYREAGLLARWLAAAVFAQFVYQIFSYVFVGTGHYRQGLFLEVVVTIVPLLALLFAGQSAQVSEAVLCYSSVTFAATIILVFFAYTCVAASDERTARGGRNV